MHDAIQRLRTALQHYEPRESRSITEWLLDEVAGITREQRFLHPDIRLSAATRRRLDAIARRLERGIPVQQALGYAPFCGLRIHVTPSTLIPRPETEELVHWMAEELCASTQGAADADGTPCRILDIGTGSGCIAVAVARLIHNPQVVAMDLSTRALAVARRNIASHAPDIVCTLQADALRLVDNAYAEQRFSTLPDAVIHRLSTAPGRFDAIVSNPPYICHSERSAMTPLVLDHEPKMALFVPDNDPLRFYRAIAQYALRDLRPGGRLYFEVNTAYADATAEMLCSMGYIDVEVRHDVTDRPRMVAGSTKN